MNTKKETWRGAEEKIMILTPSLPMLSSPPMQGATSLVENLFDMDFTSPEYQIGDEGGGPFDPLDDDARVAHEDASKVVRRSASRNFLPFHILAKLAIRLVRQLWQGETSTYMHYVEIPQVRYDMVGMGWITVLLIQDEDKPPESFDSTSFGGFTVGGDVDPLALGDATVGFLLYLITIGFLKATSGVAQPWRLCVWCDLALRDHYTDFCITHDIGTEETRRQTLRLMGDGSRLQVRVYTTLPVCSFFTPDFNITGRSSLSPCACIRFTCPSST